MLKRTYFMAECVLPGTCIL